MDTEEDKYWLYIRMPVFSKKVLTTLRKHNFCEIRRNIYGESLITLIILDKRIELPKYLTSKGALVFLGFTPTLVDELWKHLGNAPEPTDGFDIECGGKFYFWTHTTEFLEKKIAAAKENSNGHDRTKKILDNLGLTDDVQLQGIRIKGNHCEAILTSLRAQMPEDGISLARQYIKRRWEILVGLQDIITQRENWEEEIVRKFAPGPIDFTALHFLELNPWGLSLETPDTCDEFYDEAP